MIMQTNIHQALKGYVVQNYGGTLYTNSLNTRTITIKGCGNHVPRSSFVFPPPFVLIVGSAGDGRQYLYQRRCMISWKYLAEDEG